MRNFEHGGYIFRGVRNVSDHQVEIFASLGGGGGVEKEGPVIDPLVGRCFWLFFGDDDDLSFAGTIASLTLEGPIVFRFFFFFLLGVGGKEVSLSPRLRLNLEASTQLGSPRDILRHQRENIHMSKRTIRTELKSFFFSRHGGADTPLEVEATRVQNPPTP